MTQTRLIPSLDAIAENYDAVLCDLWGCYHDGLKPYADAVEALRRYRARGGIVILLTNAPRPPASVKRFLDAMGAPEDSYDAIMSSGGACQRAVASGDYGQRFHYVGPERDRHMLADIGFEDTPAEEADAILCTGFEDDTRQVPADYDPQIANWRAHGVRLLCANPDIVVDRGHERLWCAGAIAQRYADAGGEVVWFGKPHRPTYEQSFSLLAEVAGREVAPGKVLGIGDGVFTDVKGALDFGIDALFVSGGLAAAEVGDDPEHPDPKRLADWLASTGQSPQFAIGRLR
ncbi:TIGR01459 family HAD-type hydrolase [Limibaculum sp. M0105]|uniref:TIGR01459 family HAD-type hydrolase n=2 Tax=Thermohalobaculum xanthum TaxID=2753746 RepID=A0A8J7SG44_9RHOB|nr:TIGR01459 family HAD-type hydrolase [Thermohalobaculum xanthum]